jgi:hypothetical protein
MLGLLPSPGLIDTVAELAVQASGSNPAPVFGYVVRAVNRAGVLSGPSPMALTLADPPTQVSAHRRPDGSTLIGWAPPRPAAGDELAGCFVHRMDRFGGDHAFRQQGWPVLQSAWIDRVPDPEGFRRRYYVVPVAAGGQWGVPSAGCWAMGRP